MEDKNLIAGIRKKFLQSSIIDEQFKKFLDSDRPVVVYGAGRQARIVIDFCGMFDKSVKALLTSGSTDRFGTLPREGEMPLYVMHDLPDDFKINEYDVILGVDSKYHDEIIEMLEKAGATHYYAVSNWTETNEAVRTLYYRSYFAYYGAQFLLDSDGEQYLTYKTDGIDLRVYFPNDPLFRANILGEYGNILLPVLFNDERLCIWGAYEKPPYVCLRPGDIVFALGAGAGLFSCLAAAKGCEVYAFEPFNAPIFPFLKKSAKLYERNIHIVPYAVGDKDGKSVFYYNDHLDRDLDLCQSSVIRSVNLENAETETEMITLDTFMKESKLPRVDFIKSQIEYAEALMLQGAQKTLAKFSPVLSFYSPKALGNDAHLEVESLIKKANPEYVFEYYKRRVYAYCPLSFRFCQEVECR